jgi:hypothetical protein
LLVYVSGEENVQEVVRVDTNTILIVVSLLVVAALIAVAYAVVSKKKTRHLKERFGPEYERLAEAEGNRKAEADLAAREKRVEKLQIKPVPPELRERFARSWQNVQARFVDEPGAAVSEADALVRKVMESRGYPMSTFDQAAADISVHHPVVVENYRLAHDLALKREQGKATTEDLRQAFIHYRSLFEELLEAEELVEVAR